MGPLDERKLTQATPHDDDDGGRGDTNGKAIATKSRSRKVIVRKAIATKNRSRKTIATKNRNTSKNRSTANTAVESPAPKE